MVMYTYKSSLASYFCVLSFWSRSFEASDTVIDDMINYRVNSAVFFFSGVGVRWVYFQGPFCRVKTIVVF